MKRLVSLTLLTVVLALGQTPPVSLVRKDVDKLVKDLLAFDKDHPRPESTSVLLSDKDIPNAQKWRPLFETRVRNIVPELRSRGYADDLLTSLSNSTWILIYERKTQLITLLRKARREVK